MLLYNVLDGWLEGRNHPVYADSGQLGWIYAIENVLHVPKVAILP